MEVLVLIPARGGSKGLPRKNILNLCSKPLIAYTIAAALDAQLVSRVIVTTDDKEIADVSMKFGAEVPFLRPEEFASDNASTESALKHALFWLAEKEDYHPDIVVYLQPTDIFRKKGMIDAVIRKLIDDSKLESAFVAYPTHKKFWKKSYDGFVRITGKNYIPRQKAEVLFREDTGIACATRPELIRQGRRIGDNVFILPNDDLFSSIDIHESSDFWLAEKIIERERNNPGTDYYV